MLEQMLIDNNCMKANIRPPTPHDLCLQAVYFIVASIGQRQFRKQHPMFYAVNHVQLPCISSLISNCIDATFKWLKV